MSEPIIMTPNERRVIELLRELKSDRGHGTLRVEITAGVETLVKHERSEKFPART